MEMKYNPCLAIVVGHFILAFLSSGLSAAVEIQGSNNSQDPNPIDLGGVEGHLYFVDISRTRNRNEAADYCHSFGLELATVDTKNKADFLNVALREVRLTDIGFWTSARQDLDLIPFRWEGTNAQIDRSVVTSWTYTTGENGQFYCVDFYTSDRTGTRLSAYPCFYDYYTMCQS